MSLCAILVLVALAPLPLGAIDSAQDSIAELGLQGLAECFEEFASAAGPVRVVLLLDQFLNDPTNHFELQEGSLWLIGLDFEEVRTLPTGIRIMLYEGDCWTHVSKAELWTHNILTLEKYFIGGKEVLQAQIENLSATSNTFCAKNSTSAMVL